MMNLKRLAGALMAVCLFIPAFRAFSQTQVSIIPEPKEMSLGQGTFTLSPDTRINAQAKGSEKSVSLFNTFLDNTFGITLKSGSAGGNTIKLVADGNMAPEAYVLTVDKGGVTVKGGDAGIFYGLQTLQQLIKDNNGTLQVPYITVNDEPRIKMRGLMLDVGRYFYEVDYIKEFLDLMSYYKLNTFHWSLTQDCGWRIEIKKHPRLTEIGAWRTGTQVTHDANSIDRIPHGGFYTQEQIRDIVKYAADRQITIVPEINMPGHTQAILMAYPELSCTGGPFPIPMEQWAIREDVLCVGNEKVYEVMEDVLTELMELFPSEIIHIGGDEAPHTRWHSCSKCQQLIKDENLSGVDQLQSYFTHRIDEFMTDHGRRILGWDEILEGGLSPNAAVMSWRGLEGGIKAAQMGHYVIMAPTSYMYLDYYQSQDHSTEPYNIGGFVPLEKTYSFEPVPEELTPEQEKYILGVQGNVWCEFIHHPRKVEYMTYPRALAVAEIGWSPKEKKDYDNFLAKLPAQLNYLDRRGVTFRIPEPLGLNDVKIQDGEAVITLKPLVEGAQIYYTTDGSNPALTGKLYTGPVIVPLSYQGNNVKCIVRLPSGRPSPAYTVSPE